MQEIKPARKKLAKHLVLLKFAAVFLILTAWTKTRFDWAEMLVLKKIEQVESEKRTFSGTTIHLLHCIVPKSGIKL